jgi:RNA polymerase sigma-70 factor (ECF subfamily)
VSKDLEAWVPRVYRFALRLSADPHVAEDLTQETFLRAWGGRGRLRDAAAVGVWLFRITANLWRDHLRRGRSPVARAGPLVDEQAEHAAPPEARAAGRENLGRALDALHGLPPRQREVLYLSACEGLTPAEVGAVLGISPGAAKTNLSLARKRMREVLGEVITNPVALE